MNRRLAIGLTVAALAAGCATSARAPVASRVADTRLTALLIENDQLRTQLSLATRDHMWRIGELACEYSCKYKKWPEKASDLKEFSKDNWQLFIAPYETSDKLLCALQVRKDVWTWLDANGSYTFFGGDPSTNVGKEVVFQERTEFNPGQRWQYINDGHLELDKPRRVVQVNDPADGPG